MMWTYPDTRYYYDWYEGMPPASTQPTDGTIKAAVGLALGGQPEKGLAFDIDNCSVTRLDHFASPTVNVWRLPMVNQQPWVADAAHQAMHQPAGPEVTTSKLA